MGTSLTHSLHSLTLLTHSLTHFSLHKHGGRRSIAGIRESFKGKYSTCKTSAGIEFYKRNPFHFFLRSPSIFKRNPIEKIRLQFYKEIPLLFSKNHKLETIFEKCRRSSVILKIVGTTLQLDQNINPQDICPDNFSFVYKYI